MAEIIVGKYKIELSNEEKVLFPEEGITKADVIDYYKNIADIMLPHIKERPVTMQRFPDGIDGKSFYQHEVSDYFPNWIEQIEIEKKEGGKVTQVLCNKKATLIYLANQACLTPHIWFSRSQKLNFPDRLIFDLDPPGEDFEPVLFAAKTLHDILKGELRLSAFAMTTGSQGMHVVTPLDEKEGFETTRNFAQSVGISGYGAECLRPNRCRSVRFTRLTRCSGGNAITMG